MADRKYAAFFLGTMIKLSLFLVLCEGANFISRNFAAAPFNSILPPIAGAVITWIFLSVIEKNSRSFFATGYFLRNLIIGGLWGLGAAIAGPVVGLALKVLTFDPYGEPDITKIFLNAAGSGLFLAILIYGYFFHILLKDFGSIPGVIITSLLYGVLSAFQSLPLTGIASFTEMIPTVLYFAVIGAAAGMLIIGLGDMRSAASFLFIQQVMTQVCDVFTIGGRSFETDLGAPVMAVLCAVSMYIGIQKDKNGKYINY